MIQLNRTTQYISKYMALEIWSLKYFEQCILLDLMSEKLKKVNYLDNGRLHGEMEKWTFRVCVLSIYAFFIFDTPRILKFQN